MKEIILPPYLKQGDTIGIVCPSGYMPKENAQNCIHFLETQGFKVQTGPTLGGQFHYFAGTDKERLEDLQKMLDDPKIKAILFGRGGYGMSRIIDQLDFSKFKKHPKWIIGYSDITLLLLHLENKLRTASLHAPMAGAFNKEVSSDIYRNSLLPAITGDRLKYKIDSEPLNILGKCQGELIGGNLCLLAHSLGTPSAPKTKGKILFIEEVGEYIYGADRYIWQLKRAGFFKDLAGIIVGSFSDMKDTTIPFGSTMEEAILEDLKEYKIPIAFNFPVGHTERNVALKVGVKFKLDVQKKSTTLEEL